MLHKIIGALTILFACISIANAEISNATKFPTAEIQGKGPLPYNYRIIDKSLHAGGHPLNPRTKFKNSDEQVWAILDHLVSYNVKTVIDFENSWAIQNRYKYFLKHAGINRVHVPMHAFKLPNKQEWKKIKKAINEGPVYIHCKWGADRTGSVIGRYLVEEKGYAPEEAYRAVISGGTHAGYLGGLKTSWPFEKMKQFIWLGP
ncbi:MAG: dual specificity protein phosphatase family protein [Candidatus Margulisiibacteriota bacterium]|nr:dual specificity protein phosphatase family protein [Candidatus Margulisiibacteriota bacterium]